MTVFSKLSSGLGSVFSKLTQSGVSATTAHGILVDIMGTSLGAEEQPFLNVIVAQYQNPAVVQDQVTKALEVPDLTANVSSMLSQIPVLAAAAAANPAQSLGNFMNVIGGIEKELGI